MNTRSLRGSAADYLSPCPANDSGLGHGGSDVVPLVALARFADRAESSVELDWLREHVSAYLNEHGRMPLERCLQLPRTTESWRRARRDSWLCQAALLIDAGSEWATAQNLEGEWNRFISRGPWQSWRNDEGPPGEASALNKALFHATRLNRSASLNAKQIRRIMGRASGLKCP